MPRCANAASGSLASSRAVPGGASVITSHLPAKTYNSQAAGGLRVYLHRCRNPLTPPGSSAPRWRYHRSKSARYQSKILLTVITPLARSRDSPLNVSASQTSQRSSSRRSWTRKPATRETSFMSDSPTAPGVVCTYRVLRGVGDRCEVRTGHRRARERTVHSSVLLVSGAVGTGDVSPKQV